MKQKNISWREKKVGAPVLYTSLLLFLTLVFGYLFFSSDFLNPNIKFGYSLLTIASFFGSGLSIYKIIESVKGRSKIIIDEEKIMIQNRTLGYKKNFKFLLTDLKGLSVVQKKSSKNFIYNLLEDQDYKLLLSLKSETKEIDILPRVNLSPQELQKIANWIHSELKIYQ